MDREILTALKEFIQNIKHFHCKHRSKINKAICEHSPRLRVIQGYKRQYTSMQGKSYTTQAKTFILISQGIREKS